MLEVKNLVKIYKPKKGVPVKALDGVSLRFPEKGMVFLLGKSGSGKSTLLNLLGGLDRYNSGEIFIKGRSTRTFRQRHFDSYRNTYVGFIFQEYNILEEFSVGDNIALALQLQGKKPKTEMINHILRQVDLEGYGNRKPNELSGGQKQRVAIARALVKNPEIIMADEPTGALDSATGRQVLTTLKKLSRDKLVLVVSHDREFAEQYADRIVELADGKVIRDVQRQDADRIVEPAHPVYEGDSIHIPEDYTFTEADRLAITEYIQKYLSQGRGLNIQPASASSRGFAATDESRIPVSTDGYHLIRSRLPLRYAFKLGAGGLKHKKFRLVMTILLCMVAFTMFGLADTAASYSYLTTSVSSLSHPDSQVNYASLEIQHEVTEELNGADYSYFENTSIRNDELEEIAEKSGLKTYPVYAFGREHRYSFSGNIPASPNDYSLSTSYMETKMTYFSGFVAGSPELLEDMDAELVAGSLPAPGSNQIVISTYALETFRIHGYTTGQGSNSQSVAITDKGTLIAGSADAPAGDKTDISSAEDMIGKEIMIGNTLLEVSGVVDTGIDYSRYADIGEKLRESDDFLEEMLYTALYREWEYATTYSLTGMAIVDAEMIPSLANQYCGYAFYGDSYEIEIYSENTPCKSLSEMDTNKIQWLDGAKRTVLADDEAVISQADYESWLNTCYDSSTLSGSLDSVSDYMYTQLGELTVVGVYRDHSANLILFSDSILSKLGYTVSGTQQDVPITQTLSPMPTDPVQIRKLVALTDMAYENKNGETTLLLLQNPVSFELRSLAEIFDVVKDVFFWVGLVLLVFGCLLFSNFIGTSVSFKKRQIGILRAVGSRSNDVFQIFFAESFIIAMINFVLSLGGTVAIVTLINSYVRRSAGLLLTVLTVGIRQLALLLAVCLLVALVASYLPVRRIAAKRPVDAILDR